MYIVYYKLFKFLKVYIFNEMAPRLIQSVGCNIHLYVCLCDCPISETARPNELEISGQRVYR